jgi:hypothetical protein
MRITDAGTHGIGGDHTNPRHRPQAASRFVIACGLADLTITFGELQIQLL